MSSNKNAKIDCSKINEEKLIINESSTIKLYLLRKQKANIDIINDDILELMKSTSNIGKGGYNTVYTSLLSTNKCTNNLAVAVRVKKITKDDYLKIDDETIILNKLEQRSIENMIKLSKSKVHPKIYDIKVIYKNANNISLVIIMDKYQVDLDNFIKKNRIELLKKENCKMIISMYNQCIKHLTEIADNDIVCNDVKPKNIVLNYNFTNKTIDLKIIDVDADYCFKKICTSINKTILGTMFNNSQLYVTVMIVLLAQHLYYYNDFNFLNFYFIFFKTRYCENNINKYIQILGTIIRYINKIQLHTEYVDNDLEFMIKEYFDYYNQNNSMLPMNINIDTHIIAFMKYLLTFTKNNNETKNLYLLINKNGKLSCSSNKINPEFIESVITPSIKYSKKIDIAPSKLSSTRRSKSSTRRSKSSTRRSKSSTRRSKSSTRRSKSSTRRSKSSTRRSKSSTRRSKSSTRRSKSLIIPDIAESK